MWEIDKIKIKNFRSFLEADYRFNQNLTTLIFGEYPNSAADFANSNGAGKSTFLKAIEFALCGIVSKSLPQEAYINNAEDEAAVTLFMSNKSINSDVVIKRAIFRKKSKSAKISIHVNGEENKQIISESVANDYILDLLKISKDDLLNYFLVGQSNQMSFLRASDTQQKAVISRFANIDTIDPVLINIKTQIQDLDVKLNIKRGELKKIEGKIELLQDQINEDAVKAASAPEIDYEKIAKIEERIARWGVELSEYQQLFQKTEEIANQKIDFDAKISEQQNTQLRKAHSNLNKLTIQLDGELNCPKCGHGFIPKSEKSVKQINEEIKQINEEIIVLQGEIKAQEAAAIAFRKVKIARIDLEEIGSNIELLQSKIKAAQEKILQEKEIKVQKESPNEERAVALEQLAEKFAGKASEIAEIDEEVVKLKFWANHLGKGFKSFLVNKMLESLQGNINFYLSKISVFQAKIEGYKTLADGTLREKITVQITKDGDNWEQLEKFSGGQQNRIDICAVLALRRIINQNAAKQGGGLNFLGLDEAFDGLDNVGQKHIIQALDNTQETCVVISLSNDDVGFKNKIIILCEQGVSRIK